jgi:hypothetical protein
LDPSGAQRGLESRKRDAEVLAGEQRAARREQAVQRERLIGSERLDHDAAVTGGTLLLALRTRHGHRAQ